MRQFALLGAASAGFSEDRNAAQINKEKRKRLLIIQLPWQPDLANPTSTRGLTVTDPGSRRAGEALHDQWIRLERYAVAKPTLAAFKKRHGVLFGFIILYIPFVGVPARMASPTP
jgi:hypothetical protein